MKTKLLTVIAIIGMAAAATQARADSSFRFYFGFPPPPPIALPPPPRVVISPPQIVVERPYCGETDYDVGPAYQSYHRYGDFRHRQFHREQEREYRRDAYHYRQYRGPDRCRN